jgi:ribonuclease VapC
VIVLDSSTILAILFDEPGCERAQLALGAAAMSTVNIAEVYARAHGAGVGLNAANALFGHRTFEAVPLSLRQAEIAGELLPVTRGAGLSLGDRCCLALAIDRKLNVLTADRVWATVAAPLGIEIELIR